MLTTSDCSPREKLWSIERGGDGDYQQWGSRKGGDKVAISLKYGEVMVVPVSAAAALLDFFEEGSDRL